MNECFLWILLEFQEKRTNLAVHFSGASRSGLTTEIRSLYVTMCAVACLNADCGCLLLRRARRIANRDHKPRHVCPSLRPHGTTQLSRNGFW